ncbi:MAG: alpha/beta fold hydrolase [Burkholderiales bacterium]
MRDSRSPVMARNSNSNAATALETHEFRVSSDPGIEIYVRNKHPAGMTDFDAATTVLFVHGATYPAESAFDLPLDGASWMDLIAREGYDVYLLDIRGYGLSTRPPQMDAPAADNPPFATASQALVDIDAVVDFIRDRRGIDRLVLLGWSWGTATTQQYTCEFGDKVEKLVLHAPIWTRRTPFPISTGNGPLGAWRAVNSDQALARWRHGVPPDKVHDLIPPGWFEAFMQAAQASDPIGAAQTPAVVRAPNGVIADAMRQAATGRMDWDPAEIRVPVLLIVAEWDRDTPVEMARELFALMVNAPRKRYIELGEGTHMVIMEKHRMQLIDEVQLFLDERPAVRGGAV